MPQRSHTRYDLVVIGSGPAGQKAALSAAKLGKRGRPDRPRQSVGGVCIHTGTIPSKAMREAVLHLTGIRERALYGDSYAVKQDITMDGPALPLPARRSNRGGRHPQPDGPQRRGDALRHASFIDPHTIRVAAGRGRSIRSDGRDHADHV